jgi:hypothetical protein
LTTRPTGLISPKVIGVVVGVVVGAVVVGLIGPVMNVLLAGEFVVVVVWLA